MTMAGHMIKIEVIIGALIPAEEGTTLEMTGIRVNIIKMTAGTLRIETCHMTEVEEGINMIREDLG